MDYAPTPTRPCAYFSHCTKSAPEEARRNCVILFFPIGKIVKYKVKLKFCVYVKMAEEGHNSGLAATNP